MAGLKTPQRGVSIMGPVMDLSDATGCGGNIQGVDIPDVTLWLIVQLRIVYRREVKA
jgi:hypothetical protein